MIALADCNNFYASCERSIRPELEGKPIVVLSNNDGCIIARSNEAKALGYKMGVPVFKVKDKLLQDRVHMFSGKLWWIRDLHSRAKAGPQTRSITRLVHIRSTTRAAIRTRRGNIA